MHIAYLVANIEDISGGTRVIVEHVNRLLTRGHKVELWVSNEGTLPYFACNAPIKNLDESQLGMPDVVVITDPALLPNIAAHRHTRRTFLLIQHDNEWVSEVTHSHTYASLINQYKNLFLNGSLSIIVVSKWLQKVVKDRYGLDSVCIPNGIDVDVFHPDTPLLQTSDPSILLMYDPQIWKGFSEAVQAVLEVQQRIPELKLLIIGRYFPETPNIEGMSFGFPFPAVYFNRPIQSGLAKIYSSASVFVSASWQEGFGLPALEAMACGVPVVTTDSGGNREYAVADKTAVIVPQRDPHEIAKGIQRILSDSKLQLKLRQSGLRKVKRFDWDKSIKKLEGLFAATSPA